jgi:hypothetical protein
VADVTVTLGAKDEGLSAAMKGAEKGVASLGKAFAALGVAAAAVGGAKIAFDAFKGLADYAGGISDLAAQTGMTAQATMVWGQALKNAGLGAEALGQLVNKLQKAMTGVNEQGEPTNKAFERLGINMTALRAMRPDEQMDAVAKAIAALPDPAARAATAMELFGKSGGKALALFTDGSALDTARQQLGGLAENLGANIASLDKLSDAMQAAGEIKSLQFMAGFAKGFSGDLNSAADALNKIDFSKAGTAMGVMARGAKEYAAELAKAVALVPNLPSIIDATGIMSGGIAGKMIGDALRAKGQGAVDADAAKAESSKRNDLWKNLLGKKEESPAAPIEKANMELGTSFDLMTDISSLSASNLSLQDSYSASLSGAAEQLGVMVDSQNALTAAKEKEAEAAKKSAEADKEKLKTLQSQRNAAAQSQLERMAGADVPVIGERGARQRAAKKSLELDRQAQLAEDFGDTEKANKLRLRSSQLREKNNLPQVESTADTLKSIDDGIRDLNLKLPTPALAP